MNRAFLAQPKSAAFFFFFNTDKWLLHPRNNLHISSQISQLILEVVLGQVGSMKFLVVLYFYNITSFINMFYFECSHSSMNLM